MSSKIIIFFIRAVIIDGLIVGWGGVEGWEWKGGKKSIQVYQSLATGEKGVTIMNYITHNL